MKNFKRKKCYHLQRKEDKEHGQVIPKEEIDKKKKVHNLKEMHIKSNISLMVEKSLVCPQQR